LILTLVNGISVKAAAEVQDFFTAVKLLAQAIMIGFGFVQVSQGDVSYLQLETVFQGVAHIVLALYSGLFAYGGWNSLNYITEEMINLECFFFFFLFYFTVNTVSGVYVLTNLAYFTTISPQESEAMVFGQYHLGVVLWLIVVFVGLSCFGVVNGCLFTSAHFVSLFFGGLFFAGDRESHLPAALGLFQKDLFTPVPLLIFIMLGMAIAGMLWLRWREPTLRRPVRMNFMLLVLFLLGCIFMIVVSFWAALVECLIGGGIILTRIPFYFLGYKWKKPQSLEKAISKSTIFCQKLYMSFPEEKTSAN
ncbi:LAT1 protein, partial [Polyodon spathula]|nr:LAT1 protein [Polyodon spathula]